MDDVQHCIIKPVPEPCLVFPPAGFFKAWHWWPLWHLTISSEYRDGHEARFKCISVVVMQQHFTVFWDTVSLPQNALKTLATRHEHLLNFCRKVRKRRDRKKWWKLNSKAGIQFASASNYLLIPNDLQQNISISIISWSKSACVKTYVQNFTGMWFRNTAFS